MRIASLVMLVSALLAGCSGTRPQQSDPAELAVRFACTDGEALDVRFVPARRVALLILHGESVELPRQPAASGFVYSNGPTTIRGKGDDLRVEMDRMVPLECTVASR